MILSSSDVQLSLFGWQEMGLSLEGAALLLRWQGALFPCEVPPSPLLLGCVKGQEGLLPC